MMASEFGKDPRVHEEHTQWMLSKLLHWQYDRWKRLFMRSLDFQQRCIEKIEKLGDAAMGSRNYAEAIEQYTTALSRKPTNIVQILAKRSSARSLMGLWEEALDDADEVRIDLYSHVTLRQCTLPRPPSSIHRTIEATRVDMQRCTQ